MVNQRVVRVGNAGGYWGDDPYAMKRQLQAGPVDYLTQDFLAEVTMSILQKQKSRNPALGYATDFLAQIQMSLPLLAEHRTRIISNAGGINPAGCAIQVAELARAAGMSLSIAVIEGDDLMDRLDELLSRGVELANMESGESLASIRSRVLSANAYLGLTPVLKALEEKARIIITGRVTDTAITAAPPVFEFGWDLNDWDRLASAVVAGHILECGPQATGGNVTDWKEIPSFFNMSYPIAEFSADGSFCVQKHPGLGGAVNRQTVVSQLVYEMGDPRRYITPDVIADFSTIRVAEQDGSVRVSRVKGYSRPEQFKVSISYHDGYKAHGTMIVGGPETISKCQTIAEMFWKRLDMEFEESATERIGYDSCLPGGVIQADPPEVLLRLGVRDHEREKVEEFSRQFASLILSSVSGIAIVGARPRVQEVVAYWPALIPAAEICPEVALLDTNRRFPVPWTPLDGEKTAPSPDEAVSRRPSAPEQEEPTDEERVKVSLRTLCFARSGDKGDTANIGVVCRWKELYPWLCRYLTAKRVKQYFRGICQGEVERFEIDNLQALNFLLHRSLGGGGTVSLRIDPQGKTLADALLQMEVSIPAQLLPAETGFPGGSD